MIIWFIYGISVSEESQSYFPDSFSLFIVGRIQSPLAKRKELSSNQEDFSGLFPYELL